MSVPVRFDSEETQGDTFRLVLPLLDVNGDPFDFTGATVRAHVKAIPVTDDSPLAAAMTVDYAAGGEMSLSLSPAQTAGLVGRFQYDVEVQDAGGDIDTVYAGVITWAQQVTFEVTP